MGNRLPSFTNYECVDPKQAEALYYMVKDGASQLPLTTACIVMSSILIIIILISLIFHLGCCSKRRRDMYKEQLKKGTSKALSGVKNIKGSMNNQEEYDVLLS